MQDVNSIQALESLKRKLLEEEKKIERAKDKIKDKKSDFDRAKREFDKIDQEIKLLENEVKTLESNRVHIHQEVEKMKHDFDEMMRKNSMDKNASSMKSLKF